MTLGPWQILLILVIILILFGAGRLPQVMGDLGKGLKYLRQNLRDVNRDPNGPDR